MKTVLAATGALLLLAGIASGAAGTPTAISSNFNGTNIADTSFIWFNSHLTSVGGGTGQVVIRFRNQFVTLVVPSTGHSLELPIPDAEVVVDPAVNPVSTIFDSVTNRWMTSVQSTGGTPFLSGFAWDVPAGENPRAANPVQWRGEFSANQPGISISWQWSAAVYTQLSTDYNALGVTAIDGMNGISQSGTPGEFRAFVIGGARGGGGSNFTGSNSGTGSASSIDQFSDCPGDFNGDGNLDPDDLGDFINCYFASPPCPQADFNGDGSVDPDDLGDVIDATIKSPPCP
ncbi:MAG: hypothetical protein AB7K52_03385 [Phycisphaerales bacterium]